MLILPCWDIYALKHLKILRLGWINHWTREKDLRLLFVLIPGLACLNLKKDVKVIWCYCGSRPYVGGHLFCYFLDVRAYYLLLFCVKMKFLLPLSWYIICCHLNYIFCTLWIGYEIHCIIKSLPKFSYYCIKAASDVHWLSWFKPSILCGNTLRCHSYYCDHNLDLFN